MQFPITRETLRSFNRQNVIAEKEKQKRFDLYSTIIKNICTDVEQNLLNSKTPVTHYVWKDIGIIGYWYHHFINQPNADIIRSYNNERLIVARFGNRSDKQKHETLNKYLPEFIDLLKETFIDCEIIIDPLKTYLIIDWS
jgi:hypothetical protein